MARRMLVVGAVGLLVVSTVAAVSCINGYYGGVHFHNDHPDFGITPRRALLYYERDSRPSTQKRGEWDFCKGAGVVSLGNNPRRLPFAGSAGSDASPATASTSSSLNSFSLNSFSLNNPSLNRFSTLCYTDEPETPLRPLEEMDDEEKGNKAGEAMLAQAQKAFDGEKWRDALALYRKLGARAGWDYQSVRDRTEALERFLSLSAPQATQLTVWLKRYFAALDQMHGKRADAALPALQAIARDPQAGLLQEHALYQIACVSHAMLRYDQAVTEFQTFLSTYPKSPKREAALIMQARCAILPKTPAKQQLPVGENAITQLFKEFPQTRFRDTAIGLRARVLFLHHEYDKAVKAYVASNDAPSAREAFMAIPRPIPKQYVYLRGEVLAAYLRRMEKAKNYSRYAVSIGIIYNLTENMTAEEALRFRDKMLASNDLASPYFYYRLNHCHNNQKDLLHLADLADKYVELHSKSNSESDSKSNSKSNSKSRSTLHPMDRARLAEVYYRGQQYDRAMRWAESAIPTIAKDRALYVRGAVYAKRRENAVSIADYERLLKECPNSGLRTGAREMLALLYERKGDYALAVDQYFALDYQLDTAYMLDVLMTTEQVRAYRDREEEISKNPALATRDWRAAQKFWKINTYNKKGDDVVVPVSRLDLLNYSLGIRLLRDGKWADAIATLKRVPAKIYEQATTFRKEWEFSERVNPEPIAVATELGALERAYQQATGQTAKAQALYNYANYYGDHGTLLFYNPLLWREVRELSFQFHWNDDFNDRKTAEIIRKHMMEHEVYPRARELFIKMANDYPNSPLAPKALYRAAVACHRLNAFNYWWVDVEGKRHNYAQEALALKKTLIKRYPHDPLVKQASRKPIEERKLDWAPPKVRRLVSNP